MCSSFSFFFLFFFFSSYGDHRDLHSFPTRRSSDLLSSRDARSRRNRRRQPPGPASGQSIYVLREKRLAWHRIGGRRSEEHTSELQSHVNLVCRLLLEKKKKKKTK